MFTFRIVVASALLAVLAAWSVPACATEPNLEWIRTYDGPAHRGDNFDAVALDAAGNVYVAGSQDYRWYQFQTPDILVMKYDPLGNAIWTDTYDSPAHDWDRACGDAVDMTSGYLYVAGYTARPDLGQNMNMWLRKYDLNGNVVWTREYDNPAHDNDSGYAVAIDSQGSVYVAGMVDRADLNQTHNMVLWKYDANGNLLWDRSYTNPTHSVSVERNWGMGVTTDQYGNAYVTGYQYVEGQNSNVWLRKYDASGNTIWTQTYDSPAHDLDQGSGVVVDSQGNVYVTGCEVRSDLGQSYNILLRKYDANGNFLWMQTYDSPAHNDDDGCGIALDAAGNVYVTGGEVRFDLDQWYNIWTREYDPNGNVLWTKTYDSPAHEWDLGDGIAVTPSGDAIYVSGTELRNDLGQESNALLLKYSSIPEPTALMLMAPALMGMAGLILKRKMR
jgi:hypothetical protein